MREPGKPTEQEVNEAYSRVEARESLAFAKTAIRARWPHLRLSLNMLRRDVTNLREASESDTIGRAAEIDIDELIGDMDALIQKLMEVK